MFVHDLNQFVTVQLLEDTPAVLSLGNLCKDHGYSCEWVSGPTIDQKWEKSYLQDRQFRISCRSRLICQFWKQFVSITHPQESLEPDARPVSGNRAASSSSSDSVLERSDELPTRKLGQKSLSDDKQDAKDPLADMPFWL